MKTTYNLIAGGSAERLAALSDGIFGVGMTLLVLDLRLPVAFELHRERLLLHALRVLLPKLVTYALSFMTLGIFWVGQQTQLNHLERSDRRLTWIHLGFLFSVTMMPFSTQLLGAFPSYRSALLLYWATIVCLGGGLYASWGYATRHRLVRADFLPEYSAAICRRIEIAQALYALGALLCVISPYWSIAFILLVQLNYVLGIPLLGRRPSAEGPPAAPPAQSLSSSGVGAERSIDSS
jgi:uncharacterized membrane protein